MPRGALSSAVLDRLADPSSSRSESDAGAFRDALAAVAGEQALADDDFQLALYLLHELSYGSLAGVDTDLEWDLSLLEWRLALREAFLSAVEGAVGELPEVDPEKVGEALFELEAADEGPPLARRLEARATLEQFREFVVHRSAYQLREADPHSWAIPRLRGAAKVALLEVQFDEYGAGDLQRMHSHLFATTMRGLDLDDSENRYLDWIPGSTLATMNLMSAFALAASSKGATVGHLAMFEMTSAAPNRRYARGLRRLGFDDATAAFYDEHVTADSVHENIAAYDMAGSLAKAEPGLAGQIMFGAAALLETERRFAEAILDSWDRSETSLRSALPEPAGYSSSPSA